MKEERLSKRVRELLRDIQVGRSYLEKLKKPSKTSLLSAMLALQTLLGAVQLLDTFDLVYYPLIQRLTMTKTFDLGFSLTSLILALSVVTSTFLVKSRRYLSVLLSALVSAALIFIFGFEVAAIAFSILNTVASLLDARGLFSYVFWLLALMTGFEVMSLSHWVVFKPLGLPSPTMWVASLELSLFFVFGQLAPFVTLPTLYLWIVKPTIGAIARLRVKVDDKQTGEPNRHEEGCAFRPSPSILLGCAIVLAVASAFYPYIPNINPKSSVVGADVPVYIRIMEQVWEAPYDVFVISQDRPLSLLAIYGFARASGLDVSNSVKYSPLILLPLLVVSMYFMVLQATDSKCLAAISSLFTSLGFTVTVGIYAYILADMLGLTFAFTALGFLFRSLSKNSFLDLCLACILGSLVVFTHPWTFTQYYAGVALTLPFLAFESFRKRKVETILLFTFIYLASTGIVDLLKGSFLGMGGYSAASSMTVYMIDISDFWDSNEFCFRYLYGGLFSNTVLLGVAAAGTYLLDRRDHFQLLLMLLPVASSILYPFGNGTIQSRLLYNIPFGVLAAFAVSRLLESSRVPKRMKILAFALLTACMLVYLFRSLANLVYVHPFSQG